MSNNEISRLHTLPDWSRRLGVSEKAIRAAIQRGDLWFTWQLDAISRQGLQARRIGVTRIPPTGALTPR